MGQLFEFSTEAFPWRNQGKGFGYVSSCLHPYQLLSVMKGLVPKSAPGCPEIRLQQAQGLWIPAGLIVWWDSD